VWCVLMNEPGVA